MEFIKLSLEEELAMVTIDRPKSLNALNSQVYREIIATLRQVEAMDQVKVVILTGAGEKAFAAGADIAQMVHEDAVAGRRLSGSPWASFPAAAAPSVWRGSSEWDGPRS